MKYQLKGKEITREEAINFIERLGGSEESNLKPLERCIEKFGYDEIGWLGALKIVKE